MVTVSAGAKAARAGGHYTLHVRLEREKALAQAGPPQAGTLDPPLGKQVLKGQSYTIQTLYSRQTSRTARILAWAGKGGLSLEREA